MTDFLSGRPWAADVLALPVLTEAVVWVSSTEQYHLLDATGMRIISLVADGLPLIQVSEVLAEASGTPVECVHEDVTAFVRGLVALGVIES